MVFINNTKVSDVTFVIPLEVESISIITTDVVNNIDIHIICKSRVSYTLEIHRDSAKEANIAANEFLDYIGDCISNNRIIKLEDVKKE